MAELHPAVVHFPIALAIVWPIADALGLYLGRPDVSRVAVALLVLAVLTGLFATVTGQSAFDAAVAAGVAPTLLNTHADGANLYPWAMLAILVLRTAGVLKLGKKAHVSAILAGAVAWMLVVSVGSSGGALVFEHGVGVARPAP